MPRARTSRDSEPSKAEPKPFPSSSGVPEVPKPPPAVHEVVCVPLDEEGREMEAP